MTVPKTLSSRAKTLETLIDEHLIEDKHEKWVSIEDVRRWLEQKQTILLSVVAKENKFATEHVFNLLLEELE